MIDINLNGQSTQLSFTSPEGSQLLANIQAGCPAPDGSPQFTDAVLLSSYGNTEQAYIDALDDCDIVIADIDTVHVDPAKVIQVCDNKKIIRHHPGIKHTVQTAETARVFDFPMGTSGQYLDVSVEGAGNMTYGGHVLHIQSTNCIVASESLANTGNVGLAQLLALKDGWGDVQILGTEFDDAATLVSCNASGSGLLMRGFTFKNYRQRGIYMLCPPEGSITNVAYKDYKVFEAKNIPEDLNYDGNGDPKYNFYIRQPFAHQILYTAGYPELRGFFSDFLVEGGKMRLGSEPWRHDDRAGTIGTADALSFHRLRNSTIRSNDIEGSGENAYVFSLGCEDLIVEDNTSRGNDLHGVVVGALSSPPLGMTYEETKNKRIEIKNHVSLYDGIDAAQDHPGGANFENNVTSPGGRAAMTFLNADNVSVEDSLILTDGAAKYGITGRINTNFSETNNTYVGQSVQDVVSYTT